MKAIKEIVNTNRSIFSFCVVLFFFWMFTLAGVVLNVTSHTQKHERVSLSCSSKIQLSSAADDISDYPDQLLDSDSTDWELATIKLYDFNSIYAAASCAEFSSCFSLHQSIDKVALYDLYCNWKSHLS